MMFSLEDYKGFCSCYALLLLSRSYRYYTIYAKKFVGTIYPGKYGYMNRSDIYQCQSIKCSPRCR